MANRPNKHTYYLNIALAIAQRGTCLRRNYGAVIVKDDMIVSTGYTGAARGLSNCCDLKKCLREEQGIKPGTRYDICRSVHAEVNAIIQAGRKQCIAATMYLACTDPKHNKAPCYLCRRIVITSGLEYVVIPWMDGERFIHVPTELIEMEIYHESPKR